MKNSNFILVLLFLSILLACGKSNKKLADEKFLLAVNVCEQGDSLTALVYLDSIRTLYPEAFETIDKAKVMSRKINSEFLFRKQDQLDQLNERVAELEKMFLIEKTAFDRYSQYVHKLQKSDRRWNQSFIQSHLDERGELHISSNYYGKQWLNHVAIRVYDGSLQARTDSVLLEDPNNHRSDFMDTHWEKVSYTSGKENGVIQFIADNVDRNLKAAFLGQRMYFIVLEKYDKQAVKDALALSTALKLRAQVQNEIKALQSKIN